MTDELNWGDGNYERTARTLEPVAEVVLDVAAIAPGESVLDVACGTGNAALIAAQRGARAVGVDPAKALVEIARDRATASGADVKFIVGDALDLPVADASFDAVVSVFGVIFAPDADRAAAELQRTLRPGGCIVLTSWIPSGPISAVGRALFSALPTPPAAPPPWGDPEWARELLTRHGAAAVEVVEHTLPFRAASPEAWFADQEVNHPVWRWVRRQVTAERWVELREESVAVLSEANEDPSAFLTTSRYLVLAARLA
jgi:SAM-dependent methyltransferase